jgi:hypothetical protein
MTKNVIMFLLVLSFGCPLVAEVLDGALVERPNVASVSLVAFPLVPAASQISFSRKLMEIAPATGATLYAWYLVTTPYLVPGPFYEVGVAGLATHRFQWGLGVQSGVGAAVFDEAGLLSPQPLVLVIPLSAWYRIVDTRFVAFLQSETLVYSNGFVVDAELGASFSVLPSRLVVNLAGGINAGYHSVADYTSIIPKVMLTVAAGL